MANEVFYMVYPNYPPNAWLSTKELAVEEAHKQSIAAEGEDFFVVQLKVKKIYRILTEKQTTVEDL